MHRHVAYLCICHVLGSLHSLRSVETTHKEIFLKQHICVQIALATRRKFHHERGVPGVSWLGVAVAVWNPGKNELATRIFCCYARLCEILYKIFTRSVWPHLSEHWGSDCFCAPARTRIWNLLLRKQTLYPIELRGHTG